MPVIEIFVSQEELNADLEKAHVGAYMDSLANAKTPAQAREMFARRLEQKKTGWADKQEPKVEYKYKVLATFKDLQNGTYWNALVKEKINDLERTLLFYSSKGKLQKRNLSTQEQEMLNRAIQSVTKQPVTEQQASKQETVKQESKQEQQQLKTEGQKKKNVEQIKAEMKAEQQRKREQKLKGKRQ